MELKGKNVLITGSTRGIGWAIAEAFSQEGANIILNGRRPVPQELIDTIKDHGVFVWALLVISATIQQLRIY